MFNARLQPCAAGDCCHLNTLADPQHKCPKCRRHIHAICGVPDVNATNDMNSRFCFSCFPTVGLTPNLHPSPASSKSTSTSTTKTINLHNSPSSTATTSTNTNSTSSSSAMAQNYFDSIVQQKRYLGIRRLQ